MPRFYFHLRSRENHIPDDSGKELDNLNDAYAHARQLIDKILFHVGHDDADLWKVVISNDEHDAQMFPCYSRSTRRNNVMLTKAAGSGDGLAHC
jgi:hypothetical protein